MKKTAKLPMMLLGAATGFGLGIGLMVMLDRIPNLPPFALAALCLLALILFGAFFFATLVLHEAGHLLFGLLTGWRFVSFRIANVLWLRGPDGAMKRTRFSLAGTAGQCLMAPPPWREEGFPCALYNLGGVIVNLVQALVCGLLAWRLWDRPFAALILCEIGLAGLLAGCMNGIPLPGMLVPNDGSNLVSVLRSRDARRALWIQMSYAAAQAEGQRLSEMPGEWFKPFPEASMSDPLVGSVAVFAANRLMDELNFPAAKAAIDALLKRREGVLPLYRTLLTLDGACCELLSGHPGPYTEALRSPAVQQVMNAMKNYPAVLRTQYVAALLYHHNETMAGWHLENFDRMAQTYPFPQDLLAERALMTMAKEASRTDDTPQEE